MFHFRVRKVAIQNSPPPFLPKIILSSPIFPTPPTSIKWLFPKNEDFNRIISCKNAVNFVNIELHKMCCSNKNRLVQLEKEELKHSRVFAGEVQSYEVVIRQFFWQFLIMWRMVAVPPRKMHHSNLVPYFISFSSF